MRQKDFDGLFNIQWPEVAFGAISGALDEMLPQGVLNHFDDTGDGYVLSVDMPGVKKADVAITVPAKGKLAIEAKRTHRGKQYSMKEMAFLPANGDTERLEATLADGVLEVKLPKQVVPSPRMIPIKGD